MDIIVRNIGLFLHIIGIVALAGGSIGTYILDSWFWKIYDTEPEKAFVVAQASQKLPFLTQVGSGLMFLSGFILLFYYQFSIVGQLWMILKLILFVLMAVNGAVVAGRTGKQIRQLMPQWIALNSKVAVAPKGITAPLTGDKEQLRTELLSAKNKMNFFHISENAMFLITIFLGVFRIGS